jgi:hypothetical protein
MTIRGTVNKPTKVNRMRWIKRFVLAKTTPRVPASASPAARSAPALHALLRPSALFTARYPLATTRARATSRSVATRA